MGRFLKTTAIVMGVAALIGAVTIGGPFLVAAFGIGTVTVNGAVVTGILPLLGAAVEAGGISAAICAGLAAPFALMCGAAAAIFGGHGKGQNAPAPQQNIGRQIIGDPSDPPDPGNVPGKQKYNGRKR